MATTSTYPAVAARLKTVLGAALGSASVGVFRGAPVRVAKLDNIFIGGVEKGSHEYVVMRAGRKPRDEQYDLVLNINCVRTGIQEPTDAETAAFALLEEVEDTLADDPGIGLAIPTLRCWVTEFESDSFMEDQGGWRCIIVVKIRVNVRLT